MKTLPTQWQDFLAKQSETGMGYHIVNLTLEDGQQINDVVIIQSALIGEIRGGNGAFDVEKITAINVTHKKWHFQRT